MQSKAVPHLAAFAIIEALVGAALAGLMLLALAGLQSQVLILLKAQKQTNAANAVVQERIDQLREFTWANVGSGPAIQALLQDNAQRPASVGLLPAYTESITIQATTPLGVTPPATAPSPSTITVSRDAAGAVTGGTQSIGATALAVQVTALATWTVGNRTRTRGLATIIWQKGVGK